MNKIVSVYPIFPPKKMILFVVFVYCLSYQILCTVYLFTAQCLHKTTSKHTTPGGILFGRMSHIHLLAGHIWWNTLALVWLKIVKRQCILCFDFRKWENPRNGLRASVADRLTEILQDLKRPHCAHYGAIMGLMALGPAVSFGLFSTLVPLFVISFGPG